MKAIKGMRLIRAIRNKKTESPKNAIHSQQKERFKHVVGHQYKDMLELPIEENTVFFIENYRNGPTGDMINLLRACFEMEEFADYSFTWVGHSYSDVDLMFDKRLIVSNRVCIVSDGSEEYRRALAVSKYIVTGRYLPMWYIKRPGQVLVRIAGPEVNWERCLYNRDLLQVVSVSANKYDYVIGDASTVQYLCSNRSPACESSLEAIDEVLPRYQAFSTLSVAPKVVVAYSQGLYEERWKSNPDAFYDWVRRIALNMNVEHDELAINIPSKAMDMFDEESLEGYAVAVRSIFGAIPLIKGAQVVLTNNRHAFCMAQDLGVHCVLLDAPSWGEDYTDIDLDEMGYTRYERYDNEDDALDAVKRTLLSMEPVRETTNCCGSGHDASKAILERIVFNRGADHHELEKEGNRNLLIVSWQDSDSFHDLIASRFRGVADTVLFVKNTGYWILDSDSKSFADSCITFRTGFHLGSDKERSLIKKKQADELYESMKDDAGNFAYLEWRRVLGDVRFETVFAPEKHDCFWEILLRFAPGKEVVLYDNIYELCDE